MTGPRRRRRGSTSSVETVDETKIRRLQEVSVLKSVPKSLDQNDWPDFELRDAIVLNKDGHTLENALHVGTKGPFIVRGTLIIDHPDQKQHLIKKVKPATPIEIRHCNLYSLSLPNGKPVIWVSGRCGWYEMRPSPSYAHIYNTMCEATALYCHMLDIHSDRAFQKSKPKKERKEVEKAMLQYAVLVGDGATLGDVGKRCLQHGLFLSWHLSQDRPEDFTWASTAWYKWLVTMKPEVFNDDNATNVANPPKSPSIEVPRSTPSAALPSRTRAKPSVAAAKVPDLEEVETKDFMPKRSSRSRSTAYIDLTSPVGDAEPDAVESTKSPLNGAGQLSRGGDGTAFSTVLESLEFVYQKKLKSRAGLTVSATTNEIYFAYKFPTYRDETVGSHKRPVEEVLHYNAKELLRNIDKAKYEKHEIYGWLQDRAKTKFSPVALKPSDFPFRIIPRKPMPKKQPDQPSASGHVSFQAAGGKAPVTPSGPRLGKQPGRTPGKKSSLRLASGSKRPHADLENDSDTEMSVAKKSHYFSGDEDGEEMADASSEEATDDSQLSNDEPIPIVIRAEKIPSAVPRGADGTWTCDQEGCDYMVRGSDADNCKARINEHFKDHEQQTNRVNLAVAESRPRHLPINHLLDKIKKLGETAQQGEQISLNGKVLPQPIKRKLIV